MTAFDLRPLSLGEILDRTFTLYRRNFLLFIGIAAIPQIFVLAIGLIQVLAGRRGAPLVSSGLGAGLAIVIGLVAAVVSAVALFLSQGATTLAVTDLYLGRTTSIVQSLRRARGEIGSIFGVGLLSGLAILAGTVLLIVPGVIVFCRLLICIPVVLIERRGPRDALSRSWDLTKGATGRAFVIILLYFVVLFASVLLLVSPFSGLAGFAGVKNPEMMRFWSLLGEVGSRTASTLVSPILLIATSVFYFDLRVRKEAFDLQFMMDPNSERITGPSSGSVPSILS